MHVISAIEIVRITQRGCYKLHRVFAPCGLRNSYKLVFRSTLQSHDRRSARTIPACQTSVVFCFRVLVSTWSYPFVPLTQINITSTRFGSLSSSAKRTEAVYIFMISVIKALSIERGKFFLRTIVSLEFFFSLTNFSLKIVYRSLSLLILFTSFFGFIYEGLSFLVVLWLRGIWSRFLMSLLFYFSRMTIYFRNVWFLILSVIIFSVIVFLLIDIMLFAGNFLDFGWFEKPWK